MSDSLWPNASLLCPPLSPRVCFNSCLLSRWYYLTILSSATPSPFAFNLSRHQGLFQWVGSTIRWPEYWSFSFSISPSSRYTGLLSFRINWFDTLAFQGTLKSLLQRHNSEASVLRCWFFFMVQLSHMYIITGKTIDNWLIWTFVGKVMSLVFNTLSRFVIAFLPESKHLLISWLQSSILVLPFPSLTLGWQRSFLRVTGRQDRA